MFQREIDWIKESYQKDEDARLAAIQAAVDFALEEGIPYVAPPEPERKTHIMFKRLKILMMYHSIKTVRPDTATTTA